MFPLHEKLRVATLLFRNPVFRQVASVCLLLQLTWRQKRSHFYKVLYKSRQNHFTPTVMLTKKRNQAEDSQYKVDLESKSLPSFFCPHRDQLDEMSYTTMCIKETLRLIPPIPSISRELSKPLTLPDGHSLPAGLHILFLSMRS